MALETLEIQFFILLAATLFLVVGMTIGRRIHGNVVAQLNRELQLKQHLSLQIDQAPLPMLRVDRSGMITAVNEQLAGLFGYGREELIGAPLSLLIPQRFHSAHVDYLQKYFAQPAARPMALGRDLVGARKDGSEVPVEVGLNAMVTEDSISVVASIVDVSEKKRWERELAATNALMSSIIRSAPFSIIATDIDGNIIAKSAASDRLLGYAQSELLGSTPAAIHDNEEIVARAQALSQELGETIEPGFAVFIEKAKRGITEEREWTYIRKDGSRVPVSLTVTALRDHDGVVRGFLGVAYDISERKRNEEYLRHLAHHDQLTGLPNRALMYDRLNMAIERAQRFDEHLVVLLIDLNKFKPINDTLGHLAGDHLLKVVAERLVACVRATDTVARIGGDEFVIVLADVQGVANAELIAAKIIAEVSQPLAFESHILSTTPSIGAALYPQDGRDAEQLLKSADAAMYGAKLDQRGALEWSRSDRLRSQ